MIQVDYFMSHGSPWTFLGHKRLGEIIKKYKVKLNMLPVNYGEIFPISGGLPVSKRPVQRQKIRLQELKRWSKFLDINLIPQPTSFPSKSMLPSLLIIASQMMKTNKADLSFLACYLYDSDNKNSSPQKVINVLNSEFELLGLEEYKNKEGGFV